MNASRGQTMVLFALTLLLLTLMVLMTIGLGPPKFNKGVLRPATDSHVAASVRRD